jgi:hypothetical protein
LLADFSGLPRYVPATADDPERDLTIIFVLILLLAVSEVLGATLTLPATTSITLTHNRPQFVRLLELFGLSLLATV